MEILVSISKSRVCAAFLVSVFGGALQGCGSTTVGETEYNQGVAQASIGMTKSEFLKLFPTSVPRGAKAYPKGTVEVLEVQKRIYECCLARDMNAAPNWFYFYNGQLVQYGAPGDWPRDPDLVIETRRR
jgi:hypothetical protein